MQTRKFSIRTLALILALVLTQPFAMTTAQAEGTSTPTLPDPGTTGMNKQQQEQLGLQAMGEVYKQMPVMPDSSKETQYIQQLAKKLQAQIPPDKNWPYQFHVVQASDINAFALPGGPIFVNVGTITAAENEAQLAGVLAHEMSHVYMQHSAKQAPKATVAQIIAGLAGAVLPQSGLGSLARMGIQIGAGGVLMKYSRTDEAQADSVGAIIMYKAGYNPQAMADFFETLQKKYGAGGPQLLSDHPNPGNRTAAVQKEIQNWPKKNYVNDSQQFASAKQDATHVKAYSAQDIANGAKSGQWEQQNRKNNVIPANLPASSGQGQGSSSGAASGSGAGNGQNTNGSAENVSYKEIKPSDHLTRHEGQGFVIYYPDNWKAGGDQNTTIIGPPAGATQTGIAYGAIVGNQATGGGSLDDATQKLAQGMAQDNPGMKISGDIKNVDINGTRGRSLELSGNSPLTQNGQPLPEHDWLVTFPNPQGGLLYVVFVSPERDFNQLHPTYQKMLNSLQMQ